MDRWLRIVFLLTAFAVSLSARAQNRIQPRGAIDQRECAGPLAPVWTQRQKVPARQSDQAAVPNLIARQSVRRIIPRRADEAVRCRHRARDPRRGGAKSGRRKGRRGPG